jgi:hypothetical protein
MFEAFLLPELTELSNAFGGMGMHCCAAAEHQFMAFKKIPGFYAFNRVPAAGKGLGFGPAIRALGGPEGPVFVLGWIGENEVVECLSTAPAGSRFVFVYDAASVDEAKVWLERVRK